MYGSFFNERELRKLPKPPRLHPIGFIQLELAENERLHIWPITPMPVQPHRTPIHDHTFAFESDVLAGAIRNVVYDLTQCDFGAWKLLSAQPYTATGTESKLGNDGPERYSLEVVEDYLTPAGKSYGFAAYRYHVSVPVGYTATRIRVTSIDRGAKAHVVAQKDEPPPSLWKRDIVDPETLWTEIRRLCR